MYELFSNIMLQNEWESEVARFITDFQTCLRAIQLRGH